MVKMLQHKDGNKGKGMETSLESMNYVFNLCFSRFLSLKN